MLQFSNNDILKISKDEIILKGVNGNIHIQFSECRENFASENSLAESKCVADRDISIPAFIFYSDPKIMILFKKPNFLDYLKNIILLKPAYSEFHELQKTIQRLGYTSYDLN